MSERRNEPDLKDIQVLVDSMQMLLDTHTIIQV